MSNQESERETEGPGPFYEDFSEGETYDHGSYTMGRDEIVRFAEQYDPQPFHTDETVARDSFFGALTASGWHTAAVTMRLFVDFLGVSGPAGSIGVGVDNLRWRAAVQPGAELSVEITVKERSGYDDEYGYLRFGVDVHTETETKLEAVIITLFERREPRSA